MGTSRPYAGAPDVRPASPTAMIHPRALLPLLLLAASCGGEADSGVPEPHSGLPAGHPGIDVIEGASFAGRAVLKGRLAEAEEGFLMISLFPAGTRLPILSYRVAMGDPALATDAEGRRVLTFRLDDQSTLIPGRVPAGTPLEIGIRYDADGYVETKDGDVEARVAARPGDEGLELVLDPDA